MEQQSALQQKSTQGQYHFSQEYLLVDREQRLLSLIADFLGEYVDAVQFRRSLRTRWAEEREELWRAAQSSGGPLRGHCNVISVRSCASWTAWTQPAPLAARAVIYAFRR